MGMRIDDAVSITGEELRPYKGIIYIRDGYWTAIEFNARSLFPDTELNSERKIPTTEYCYANNTVYRINNFSPKYGLLSTLDKGPRGERSIKGDGSTSDTIVSEFDK